MVCLGIEPRVAGWLAQTTPVSYGGTHPIQLRGIKQRKEKTAKQIQHLISSSVSETALRRNQWSIFPINALRSLIITLVSYSVDNCL